VSESGTSCVTRHDAWVNVEGFDVAELERKVTALEQRFLETTIGVRDPKADEVDLLSQLRHRTNNIVDRIVSRPNLRFISLLYHSRLAGKLGYFFHISRVLFI